MAEVKDTPGDAIDAFNGSETDDQAEYALRDFHAKDIAIAAANRAGSGGPGGTGGYATTVFLHGKPAPAASQDWDTSLGSGGNKGRYSDAQNAYLEWNIGLAAGIYAIDVEGLTFDGAGIITFTLDGDPLTDFGASTATLDQYAGVLADYVTQRVCDDLEIATGAVFALRLTMATKNASSSGYQGSLYWVQIQQVA